MKLPRVRFTVRGMMIAVAVLAILVIGLLQDGRATSREAARRSRCANNLRQIALALQSYHGRFGCFPPPYLADAGGKPMHSWRTMILPFLGRQDLYDAYDLNEPWDGPKNRRVTDQDVGPFRCPSRTRAGRGLTDYVVVTGPGTAFPGGRSRVTASDVRDDPARTVLVTEAIDMGIRWAEPRDPDLTRMALTINDPARKGLSSGHPRAVNVVMMDGSYAILRDGISPETVRALLTVDGSDPAPLADHIIMVTQPR